MPLGPAAHSRKAFKCPGIPWLRGTLKELPAMADGIAAPLSVRSASIECVPGTVPGPERLVVALTEPRPRQ